MPFLGLGSAPGSPADNSVTSQKIADGTVTATDLHTTAITDKLGYTPVTEARTITINGTSYDLTANRTWTITSLPSQTGNSGKYLTTDGTTASWATVSVTPTAVSDQANSSTGYFDLPAGTTAQRPETPSTGMIRYNTTIGFMEIYNATGWISIASPPAITSVSPSDYSGNTGTTITINGSNFDSGAVVSFSPTGVNSFTNATTTFVNSSQLTATTPIDYTVAQGPLSVRVANASGLSVVLSSAITTGTAPTWSTASGTLVTVSADGAVSTSVTATDTGTGGGIQSYAVTSGALPSGVTLNTSTGAITGTAPSPANQTTYTFGITATDNAGNTTGERSFNIIVLGSSYSATYLIVAGGGGAGASNGAGGGAGGVINNTMTLTKSSVYTATVGAGGASGGTGGRGTQGNNSALTNATTAIGGGAGANTGGTGGSGGSGGGGSGGGGGSATAGQGNSGGNDSTGGGGGGWGAAGSGITGGNGSTSSITGSSLYYGGGGAGRNNSAGTGAGLGGGGAPDTAGTANTGGGGGGWSGGGTPAGAGGSGVVILSVPTANYTGTTTGSPTVTTSGSNTIIKFTSSGSYTA